LSMILLLFDSHLAISLHFPIRDNGHVPTMFQKLHDLLSFSRHLRPSRFCVRVLFETAKFVAVKSEVNLLEAALRRCENWICRAVDLDVLRAVNEGLTPNAD
jgi:hypothetical protein